MKKNFLKTSARVVILVALGFTATAGWADPYSVSLPRDAVPPNIVSTANKPMMMLATSKDHTLFGPVYTDFEDLDGDGTIDTTFKPDFRYYGYFDATKCYVYQNNRFEPTTTATKASTANGTKYSCGGASQWAGNFMNWATMSRLDVVRKMLYGGKRSTDTATVVKDANGVITNITDSVTVLERANLSKDSHSFVKYYRGTDIREYTPFTVADLTKSSGSNSGKYAGLSICNRSTEMGEGGTPVIRLAKGNYLLWATVEGTVCEWGAGFLGKKLARYYKDVDKGNGGIAHEENPPSGTTDGAYGSESASQLNVRVQVCKAGMLGDERCTAVPENLTSNYKPFGILQEFGLSTGASQAARVEFGVITGSYDHNTNAGALRKTMGDFADEINTETGVFCHSATGVCTGNTADGRAKGGGAIQSIDNFVLYGREGAGYAGAKPLPKDLTDGTLPAWGNPIGEMVIQALQYYANKSETNPPPSTKDASRKLVVKAWDDPLSNANATRRALYGNSICRPMYTLALSSSALGFDGATGANADTQGSTAFGTLVNASSSLSGYTDRIGQAEGLNGTTRSVGKVDGTFGQSCSGKTVSTLSQVSGICPDAPGTGGTYQVAGAALYANTSKIRNITANVPPDLNTVQDALKVKTLTASLSGGAARVEVPIPNSNPRKYVYITPESLWNGGGNKQMPGALLTFNAIATGKNTSNLDYGTFVVTWNDAQMGGDYDMDIAGFLRYDVVPRAGGYDIKITTDILNVGAGDTGTHGFSVIGTDRDGRYLTHRHNRDDAIMAGAEGDLQCLGNTETNGNRCNVSSAWNTIRDADYPYAITFKMVGVDNVLVQDPLWYAAKYGYFPSSLKQSDGTYSDIQMPPNQDAWDHYKADGSVGQDGVPDGYFLARRPDILEQQLRRALTALADSANAAPATSSAQLLADGYKYTVGFSTESVSGGLEAYQADADGNFEAAPKWNAGTKLKADAGGTGNMRTIITNSGNGTGSGMPFRWGSLDAAYKALMTTSSKNVMSEANAQVVLNYVRGNQSLEGANGLRDRGSNLLGPIVNAEPWVQRRPDAVISGDGYGTHFSTYSGRDNLLWAAANDGMVHAFDPLTGVEKFAYVPGVLANRLAEIPLQRGGPTGARTQLNGVNFVSGSAETKPEGTVWAYVDSSPFTADVKVGSNWKTYLFGTLGRGGRAVYALDVTDPSTLTEGSAASIFKWQFSSDDDPDLGYVSMGKVLRHANTNQAMPIVKMNNGKYALLLGNGHHSTSGKAALFILYMDGPNGASWTGRYTKIVADAGANNGLAMANWEDYGGDGTADVIYAGDLQGNMWKFDVSSADETKWGVAFKDGGTNKPLYRATYVNPTTSAVTGLPITTVPQLVYRGQGGLTVNFGTGNAFEGVDFPKPALQQRFYGIWDRPGLGETGKRALPSGLATLKQRVYVRDATTGYITLDSTSGANVDYTTQDGWYATLPASSEMVLSNPELSAGVVAFTSVRPKSNALNYCSTSPDAALYTIDPLSGRADRSTQGVTTSGGSPTNIIGGNIGDQIVRVVNDRTKKPFNRKCTAGEPGCTCTGSDCTKPATCGPGQSAKRVVGKKADATICYSTAPRVQWREIPGLRTDQ